VEPDPLLDRSQTVQPRAAGGAESAAAHLDEQHTRVQAQHLQLEHGGGHADEVQPGPPGIRPEGADGGGRRAAGHPDLEQPHEGPAEAPPEVMQPDRTGAGRDARAGGPG